MVVARGLVVTGAESESFDDLDIIENDLPSVEFLRELFLNILKGILFCEMRLVFGNEAG